MAGKALPAFVFSHDRPLKAHTERDFPAGWKKPVDAALPPYVASQRGPLTAHPRRMMAPPP